MQKSTGKRKQKNRKETEVKCKTKRIFMTHDSCIIIFIYIQPNTLMTPSVITLAVCKRLAQTKPWSLETLKLILRHTQEIPFDKTKGLFYFIYYANRRAN